MENKEYSLEYNEVGNIIFSYKLIKLKNTSFHIIIPLIILGGIVLWELASLYTLYSLIIALPLLLYFLSRWVGVTEEINKSKEEDIIFRNLNPVISKDINSIGEKAKELERKYVIEAKEYKTEKRFVLVLLSNGNELRYNILNPKSYGKILRLEIDVEMIKIG